MLSQVRRRFGWKIFLTYMIVILVGIVVLATSVEFTIPTAFNRHMAGMSPMMENVTGLGMMGGDIGMDLYTNFRAAVIEALTRAALAALLAAVIASLFVTRQVVAPVRAMMVASQRIAEGHYDERVRVMSDVSKAELDELGQLALSFNQMASRLEHTEEIRRQLIGDVSHELRTPLTTIKGSMEGLMDGVLPAEVETFQFIHAEADRLQRLVEDLQELSQVEAGSYVLDLHPITVSSLVETVTTRLGRQFEEKDVSLEAEIPTELPAVLADEDRIGQVLLNLVGNALQYTPSGGRVSVKAQPKDDQVHITVTDTGIGIPTEHLPNLFTRFYRVDKSRSRAGGGSGIGLTVAKHLVEAHSGQIWAESPGPGQGSTFAFALPVVTSRR